MMNSNEYKKAMDCFQPDPFLRARIGAAVKERKRPRVRPFRRAAAAVIAAALALTCTMAAAMAVSPELRATVISLFQLGQAEQVPGIPAGVNEVRQVTLGGAVTARYVKVEGYWSIAVDDGLLRKGSSWNRQGCQFYELREDALTEVGADAPTAEPKTLWNGEEYAGRFRWFIHDGQLYLDDRFYEDGDYSKTPIGLEPRRLGSRTDVAVLSAMGYDGYETNYFWIYDLERGQVRDVLADCGVEALGPTRWVQFSEDLNYALVQAGATSEGTPYLVDLNKKTCTPLSELFGMEIKEFQMETGEGGYRASLCGDDTVLLTTGPKNSTWTYHIPSGAVVCTVEDGTNLKLIESQHSMLALSADGDGGVWVVDIRTGGRVKLEGVDAGRGYLCRANSTDTKLLWAEWDEVENNVVVRIDRLGVIDLETGVFTVFQREGLEELRENEWAYWLNDSQVMVVIDPYNGAGYDPETRESFLCIYEF